jgi:hypothetical protein
MAEGRIADSRMAEAPAAVTRHLKWASQVDQRSNISKGDRMIGWGLEAGLTGPVSRIGDFASDVFPAANLQHLTFAPLHSP